MLIKFNAFAASSAKIADFLQKCWFQEIFLRWWRNSMTIPWLFKCRSDSMTFQVESHFQWIFKSCMNPVHTMLLIHMDAIWLTASFIHRVTKLLKNPYALSPCGAGKGQQMSSNQCHIGMDTFRCQWVNARKGDIRIPQTTQQQCSQKIRGTTISAHWWITNVKIATNVMFVKLTSSNITGTFICQLYQKVLCV